MNEKEKVVLVKPVKEEKQQDNWVTAYGENSGGFFCGLTW